MSRFTSIALSGLAAAAVLGGGALLGERSATARQPAPSGRPGAPIVVELFTSQGCSSCPPANDALIRLADQPNVIALTFDVQLWDSLGWRDTLARPEFSRRQEDYNRHFGRNNVYTPQTIVAGRWHGPGGGRGEMEALMRRAGTVGTTPAVRLAADSVALGAGPAPARPADVWLARYDPRIVRVPIRAGENGGRTLPQRNVVRQFVRLGAWSGQAARFALPTPSEPGLRTAVLVQEAGTGTVLSAAAG